MKSYILAALVASSLAADTPQFSKVADKVRPHLSSGAEMFLPGSDGYNTATERWSASIKPGFIGIVKVATEEDVQTVIEGANALNLPYLAITGGHGGSTALNTAKNAVGIYMRGLTGTTISGSTDKGPIAVVKGGSLSGEVIDYVWGQGKTLVAGACGCTGFTSPMLGGGHGWLEGQYGVMSDNLISANLVLANGSAITVSSTQNSDLYWGIRGAGHNFGIVTSVNYQVYDRKTDVDSGFATATYIFTQDKLESVFTIANQWIAATNRPVELTHYAVFVNVPQIDPTNAIIQFLVYWQGTTIPAQYTDPLNALGPINVAEAYVDLPGASVLTGADVNGQACQKGASHQTYPVDLFKWDVNNLRTVLNIYGELPAKGLGNSIMMLEGFSVNKVQAIAQDSSAFPSREYNLLASPLFTYAPGDSSLDNLAEAYGKRIRAALLNNTGLTHSAYVNYAYGDESNAAVYGPEAARLEKLKALKKKYDPEGKFNFFEPIEV
ncbi:FAD-binding domain-containing protein [Byssothecium circinans]|uniref:FAD-binding domain-containing protein n=1 Tax=Byssothecium circinans TaxID=147558 RepID=A0A6A5U4C3_9PLEO|nr:FAD-binding domain-containing protein [Byssothecium circinans]